MIVETITKQDKLRTQHKFDLWDQTLAEGLFEKGDIDSILMLQDPTVWAYAFLEFQNKVLKMYSYQDMMLNDPSKRIMFVAANQVGKSIALCVKALHFATTSEKEVTVLMCSKTLPQAKDLLFKIKNLLKSNDKWDWKESVLKDNETSIIFEMKNSIGKRYTTRIVCTPATEAALGYPADLLLIDELAFFENGEHFYFQIAQPRTYTTKGQIIVFSNPNGRQGIFWKLYNDPDFSKYRFNYLICPTNTREEYEKLKIQLPSDKFASTVDARFTSAGGSLLTNKEINDAEDESLSIPKFTAEPVYIFADIAKVQDRSVIHVGKMKHKTPNVLSRDEDRFEVIESVEFPQGTDYRDVAGVPDSTGYVHPKSIASLIKQYPKVVKVGVDATGVGDAFNDLLKTIGIYAEPIKFSLQTKSKMYMLLKLMFEQRRIKIPMISEFRNQLEKLVMKKSASGDWMVHHMEESDRDDYPDALAGLLHIAFDPENAEVSCVSI